MDLTVEGRIYVDIFNERNINVFCTDIKQKYIYIYTIISFESI